MLPEIPDNISQFINYLSQDFDFISLDTIQSYSIIPFLYQILHSFPDENILSLVLSIIDYLLNLSFTMLTEFDQNEIFTSICDFFDISSDQIRIGIACVFHSAVLYDDSDDDFNVDINDETNETSDKSENDIEEPTNLDTNQNALIEGSIVMNKVINLFIQQSYIWAADVTNEDLQFICLDFQLIIIDLIEMSVNTITTLSELYLNIFQAGPEKLKALSITCLLRIMIRSKIIVFDQADVVIHSLKMIQLEDNYLDHFIFEFLAAYSTLLLEGGTSISFLHELINFQFLCEKMVESTDQKTIYNLCLLFNSFVNNGPDSIEILLNSNFLDSCIQKLSQGNVVYCKVISGSIKDIFLLGTATQSFFVFQSGLMGPLLQFFEDSFDETSPAVLNATCIAIQKCTEELGSDTFHEIQAIFSDESMDALVTLSNSRYELISRFAENLIQLLDF